MKRQIQTSICLSVCLSIYLSIYLHQSIPLSLSAYESIHIFICLSIHPSTYSFIYSYNYISISEKNGERIFIFVHLLHITFIYMRYIHSFFIHIYLRSSFSPTQHKTMYQKLASLDTQILLKIVSLPSASLVQTEAFLMLSCFEAKPQKTLVHSLCIVML